MISKVLIANRGEIAVRIIRACREAGLSTVAVCSTADRNSLHAMIADETICIGGPKSSESYLNQQAIISACEITGSDAVHPGFGFLSENASFADLCEKCGIKFIGPKAEVIGKLGNKSVAKKMVAEAGVPVIPGSNEEVVDEKNICQLAEKIGYPLLIKASLGGGGRGIRKVNSKNELISQFEIARSEARACFGNDNVYLEKFIENPKHIEFQILADEFGNIIHLGERDCSMQRKNQKMIEEAPSVILNDDLRDKMGKAAVKAAKACGYTNAGTVEFLLEGNENFYFMEMNTRIQVEHPITEFISGIDIVKKQLEIADGKKIEIRQKDISLKGHAIECRINAENPYNNFCPSPGEITALHFPGGPGIRIDSAVYQGYVILPFYDSMIAKLIAYAPTREEAISKMRWALSEFIVGGVNTNIDFLLELIRKEEFSDGDYSISYLENYIEHNI